MYKLGTAAKVGSPPVLLNADNKVLIENDYVIGSTIYVNKNTLEEVDPSWKGSKLNPDKHWKIYPSSLFNSSSVSLPLGNVYTNFVAPGNPGHFLYYSMPDTAATKEYASLLTQLMNATKEVPQSLYTKANKKLIEAELKEANSKIKRYEKELSKLKIILRRQVNKDKRDNVVSRITEAYKSKEKEIESEINNQLKLIQKLEKDLKIYKIKKI